MANNHFISVYEQYWLHARHQEAQRLWFANIYAVIVAGTLAYFGAIKGTTINNAPLLMFLVLLSLLGYVITYSWNIPFTIFTRLAEEVAVREWDLQEDYRRFTKYRKGYEFQKRIGWGKVSMEASANTAFMGFYSLMTGIFVTLLLQLIRNICIQTSILIVILIFVGLFSCYKFCLKKKSIDKIQNDFEDRIRKYDQQKAKETR